MTETNEKRRGVTLFDGESQTVQKKTKLPKTSKKTKTTYSAQRVRF